MATTIIEYIAQNILTTLSGVTTGAGYNYTIIPSRHHQIGDKPQHLGVIVHQGDPQELVNSNAKQEWMAPFELECYVIQSESDTTPTDQYLNNLWGDIAKAILTDRTRGAYAIDTFVRKPEFFRNLDGSFEGITILVEVHYRTQLDNPFSL
ncbi:MAG: hypothetical protein ABIP54_03730 [Candidatus Andersenbacteria bacterium]